MSIIDQSLFLPNVPWTTLIPGATFLPESRVRGKHCWHPIAVMGVVDTFFVICPGFFFIRR